MGRRVESEELELEPLLISSHNLQSELDVDDMSLISDVRDVDYDKDAEKVDTRAVSVAESFTDSSPEELRLVRKLDTRILPIVCILYLFACESLRAASTWLFIMLHTDLDRSNLGNARLQGLPQDTLGGDPSGKLFDWVNSAFFFSYVSQSTLRS